MLPHLIFTGIYLSLFFQSSKTTVLSTKLVNAAVLPPIESQKCVVISKSNVIKRPKLSVLRFVPLKQQASPVSANVSISNHCVTLSYIYRNTSFFSAYLYLVTCFCVYGQPQVEYS